MTNATARIAAAAISLLTSSSLCSWPFDHGLPISLCVAAALRFGLGNHSSFALTAHLRSVTYRLILSLAVLVSRPSGPVLLQENDGCLCVYPATSCRRRVTLGRPALRLSHAVA